MGGKTEVARGALSRVADWMERSTPELRSRIMDLTHAFSEDAGNLSKLDRKTLLDYLRGVGGQAEWKDMFPGGTVTYNGVMGKPSQIAAPSTGELWYRGATPRAKLPDSGPVFSTRDPEGAAWYATERSGNPQMMGSVTQYKVDARNPARQRDMWDALVSNPKLAEEAQAGIVDPYNVWDRLYHPDVSRAIKERGFDSALGHDVLERGYIEALIALDKGQMQPVSRALVAPEGSGVLEKVKAPLYNFDDYGNYLQIGQPRPFTRRACGGLVQMKGGK